MQEEEEEEEVMVMVVEKEKLEISMCVDFYRMCVDFYRMCVDASRVDALSWKVNQTNKRSLLQAYQSLLHLQEPSPRKVGLARLEKATRCKSRSRCALHTQLRILGSVLIRTIPRACVCRRSGLEVHMSGDTGI